MASLFRVCGINIGDVPPSNILPDLPGSCWEDSIIVYFTSKYIFFILYHRVAVFVLCFPSPRPHETGAGGQNKNNKIKKHQQMVNIY